MLAGLMVMMVPSAVWAEEAAYEDYSEEVTVFANANTGCDVIFLPDSGEACGYRYICRFEEGRWFGNWFSVFSVFKTVTMSYTVDGERVTETKTSMLQAYDQTFLDMETGENSYSEDFYYFKGAELSDDGEKRRMVFDPEPDISEITIVYKGQEVIMPFVPVIAEVTKVTPYYYTVMLKDEEDAAFYVEEPLFERRELSGAAFENRNRNDNRYDVMNYAEITGFDYSFNAEAMTFEKTVQGTYLAGCYGFEYDTAFDEGCVRPVAQAIITFSGGRVTGYECYGTVEIEGEVSFDGLDDGYLLKASDDGRTVTGSITEDNGTVHDIGVYLAVRGPVLYASYVVSIPAEFTLSVSEDGRFRGSFPIGVSIVSNNEDFYVEVVPEAGEGLVLTGELTGDVLGVNVLQEVVRFQIGEMAVPYSEVRSFLEEDVVLESEGRPVRADTYRGAISFTISSGIQ
ncbi:MAG TPA: hypothetical protein DCL38_07615 [Lachnospiraceae bacterium]|nr:hypothetical protein [Lachnospiraceae bacterium]